MIKLTLGTKSISGLMLVLSELYEKVHQNEIGCKVFIRFRDISRHGADLTTERTCYTVFSMC